MVIDDHMTVEVQRWIYSFFPRSARVLIDKLRQDVVDHIVGVDLRQSLASGFRIEGYELTGGVFFRDIRAADAWLWSNQTFRCEDNAGDMQIGIHCSFRLQHRDQIFRMWDAGYGPSPQGFVTLPVTPRGPFPAPRHLAAPEQPDDASGQN